MKLSQFATAINIFIWDPQIFIDKTKGHYSNIFSCVIDIQENEHSLPGQLIVNIVLNMYYIRKSIRPY